MITKIYENSPIFIQNMLITVAGYKFARERYGKKYYEARKFFKDFDKLSLEEQLDYQNKRLADFVNYVEKNSTYYRSIYKGIDISDINVGNISKLPILEKEELRSNMDDVIAIPKKGAVIARTGGTTGKSLMTYFTKDDQMERMAFLDHFKSRFGFEHRKMKRASFSGKHIVPPRQKSKVFWRYNRASLQLIFSSFHLSEDNIRYYIDQLNKFKPKIIDGFFVPMCDIASYIERHNLKLEFIPIGMFPTSETVDENGRRLVERVFKCKVYDQYASSEGAPFVTECSRGKLHVELATGVIERLAEDTQEVLVTSFTTHGTPLVRYKIGDSMVFSEGSTSCGCGLNSPTIESIQGRSLDFLYTPEGAKINGGNAANLFKNMPNSMIKAQIIQDSMTEITVLLEVDKKLYTPEHDKLLLSEFLNKFGAGLKVVIKHVDSIDREASGKFRFIKNSVKE